MNEKIIRLAISERRNGISYKESNRPGSTSATT